MSWLSMNTSTFFITTMTNILERINVNKNKENPCDCLEDHTLEDHLEPKLDDWRFHLEYYPNMLVPEHKLKFHSKLS